MDANNQVKKIVKRLTLKTKFGLTPPLKLRLGQARTALLGEDDVPEAKAVDKIFRQLHLINFVTFMSNPVKLK
jgi:hypothetical protein